MLEEVRTTLFLLRHPWIAKTAITDMKRITTKKEIAMMADWGSELPLESCESAIVLLCGESILLSSSKELPLRLINIVELLRRT
jgi:hypothetical protein